MNVREVRFTISEPSCLQPGMNFGFFRRRKQSHDSPAFWAAESTLAPQASVVRKIVCFLSTWDGAWFCPLSIAKTRLGISANPCWGILKRLKASHFEVLTAGLCQFRLLARELVPVPAPALSVCPFFQPLGV